MRCGRGRVTTDTLLLSLSCLNVMVQVEPVWFEQFCDTAALHVGTTAGRRRCGQLQCGSSTLTTLLCKLLAGQLSPDSSHSAKEPQALDSSRQDREGQPCSQQGFNGAICDCELEDKQHTRKNTLPYYEAMHSSQYIRPRQRMTEDQYG